MHVVTTPGGAPYAAPLMVDAVPRSPSTPAERAAEDGIWTPVLRPALTRWLDLALVIDQSPSMAVWARTVEELRRLLERHGAFRDVRIWLLNTDRADGRSALYAGTESATSLLLTGMWYYATEHRRLVDATMSDAAIERARLVTLSRSGIFLGAFGLAFVRPDWGLDALLLIYVFQVIQARRGKQRGAQGPISTLISELRRPKAPTSPPSLPETPRPPS